MHSPSLPSSKQGSSNTSRLNLSRLCDKSVEPTSPATEETQPKLHTALLRCHSRAQRKATLPSASHQLIYKNYRRSYRCVCSGLLVLGFSPERNRVGKGKTGQHLSLFQAKVVPRQVLLGSPSQMNKIPYDSDCKEILG